MMPKNLKGDAFEVGCFLSLRGMTGKLNLSSDNWIIKGVYGVIKKRYFKYE